MATTLASRPCMRYHQLGLLSLQAHACLRAYVPAQSCSVPPATTLRDLQQILDRQWLLPISDTQLQRVTVSHTASGGPGERLQSLQSVSLEIHNDSKTDVRGTNFYVIRDDLLHPIMGGNKLRKLDALIPVLKAAGVSDVVTCGGCQSAHTAAVAVAAAERGIRAHLLLRGESPDVPTGYNLVCGMFGHVYYIRRSEYADRQAILAKHAADIAGSSGCVMWLGSGSQRPVGLPCVASPSQNDASKGSTKLHDVKKVAVIKEGAGDALALLGLIRLVEFLCRPSAFGCSEPLKIIVDCGTGTTAIGLALGVALYRLPWQVVGVMLADTDEKYDMRIQLLLSEFRQLLEGEGAAGAAVLENLELPIKWVERHTPRRFGNVHAGEIELCRKIARQTGVLLDPIYTLAAWEAALSLCRETGRGSMDHRVAILHTGGTLNLFSLSQRFPSDFRREGVSPNEITPAEVQEAWTSGGRFIKVVSLLETS